MIRIIKESTDGNRLKMLPYRSSYFEEKKDFDQKPMPKVETVTSWSLVYPNRRCIEITMQLLLDPKGYRRSTTTTSMTDIPFPESYRLITCIFHLDLYVNSYSIGMKKEYLIHLV